MQFPRGGTRFELWSNRVIFLRRLDYSQDVGVKLATAFTFSTATSVVVSNSG